MKFQVMIDSRYRFLSLSSAMCGFTHESLEFSSSAIGKQMSAQGLTDSY